ncbi:hypothetical protein E1287_19160 [Actinomadura sp. KC06]|uniref:hypothetical protein n=1 Tax=Actinomadura sp. KC06 TaxID=2530369 RepID=UPI00104E1307|nr:hypothetical protein [Actinomadura sp. KC06]TDD33557.1 hypothetical protein E1287_19160 [Actinomadura sp. KC06]
MDVNQAWAPEGPRACTLPTAQRPLREAEFDKLFAEAATGVERAGPGRTRVRLRPGPETAGRAASLAARENACCSFFTFTLTISGGDGLTLDVTVPAAHTGVLDALTARAESVIDGGQARRGERA